MSRTSEFGLAPLVVAMALVTGCTVARAPAEPQAVDVELQQLLNTLIEDRDLAPQDLHERLRSQHGVALEDAATALQAAANAARENDDTREQARLLFGLAQLSVVRQDLPHARELFLETQNLQRAGDDLAGFARTSLALALVYKRLGSLGEAEAASRRALGLDSGLDIAQGAVHQLSQIGYAYLARADSSAGQRLLAEARGLDQSLLEPLRRIDSIHRLGNRYAKRGALGYAQRMYREALSISLNAGAWRQIAMSYYYIGLLHEAKDENDEALASYGQALVSARRGGQCALVDTLEEVRQRLLGVTASPRSSLFRTRPTSMAARPAQHPVLRKE